MRSETDARAGRRATSRISPRVAVWAVIALGVALRLWYLARSQPPLTGDQAVTGIMAREMAAGRAPYVFFAGQDYNGAIEQWTQAGFYAVTRVEETPFTLRLVEVLWWIAAAWLLFAVGRRALGNPWRAIVAVTAFALGPYISFLASLRSQEAYTSLIVFGLLALLLADRLRCRSPRPTRDSALLGLVVGLALWNGLTAYELLLPAAAVGGGFFLRRPRLLLVVAPMAVVGLLPSLVWSVRNHYFALLYGGPAVEPSTLHGRASIFLHSTLPQFLSLRPVGSATGWPPPLQHLAYAAIAVVTVIGYGRRRHQLAALLRLRRTGFTVLDGMLVALPLVLVVFVASKYSWSPARPDYTYVLTPVLAVLFAATLPHPTSFARTAAAVAVCTVFASNLLVQMTTALGPARDTSGQDLRAVGAYLQQHGEPDVYANYFTAMPLMYWDQAIRASSIGAGRGHFPGATAAGDAAVTPAYVVATRDPQLSASMLAARLTAHRVTFTRTTVGGYTVFDRLGTGGRPWQIGLEVEPADLAS